MFLEGCVLERARAAVWERGVGSILAPEGAPNPKAPPVSNELVLLKSHRASFLMTGLKSATSRLLADARTRGQGASYESGKRVTVAKNHRHMRQYVPTYPRLNVIARPLKLQLQIPAPGAGGRPPPAGSLS